MDNRACCLSSYPSPLHHLVYSFTQRESPQRLPMSLSPIKESTSGYSLFQDIFRPIWASSSWYIANSQNHNIAILNIGNCQRKNSSNHSITIFSVRGQIYSILQTIPLHCVQLHSLAWIQAAANKKKSPLTPGTSIPLVV